MKTVFVGDVDISLSERALEFDKTAFLLHKDNYKTFFETSINSITVYTSLGDLPKDTNVFYKILQHADHIVYSPPDHWKNNKTNNLYKSDETVQGLTEIFLIYLAKTKKISGLENIDNTCYTLDSIPTRLTKSKQLWVAGCSCTFGNGVNNDQTYGYLLSKSLDLPYINLALGGTSISWSADRILRSDIKEGDIVVWGLTHNSRISYYANGKLVKLLPYHYAFFKEYESIYPEKNLYSENTFHQAIASIEQVVNFCYKVKAQLIIFSALAVDTTVTKYLFNKQYYLNIDFDFEIDTKSQRWDIKFIDLGTDNLHPGPEHHKFWHNKILEHIKNQSQAFTNSQTSVS